MDKKKLLTHLVILMFLMFVADRLATKFYLYYSIWWSDMVMHFFGGFWVGLFFFYVFSRKEGKFDRGLEVIVGVLCVGIFWEIFELVVNNHIGKMPFSVSDTASDLFWDLVGGLLAFFYCRKVISPTSKSTV